MGHPPWPYIPLNTEVSLVTLEEWALVSAADSYPQEKNRAYARKEKHP